MSVRSAAGSCQAAFVTSEGPGRPVRRVPQVRTPRRSSPAPSPGRRRPIGRPAAQADQGPTPDVAAAGQVVRSSSPRTRSPAGEEACRNARPSGPPYSCSGLLVVGRGRRLAGDPRLARPPAQDGGRGAAYDYLTALKKGDEAEVARLGVVQDPPSPSARSATSSATSRATAGQGQISSRSPATAPVDREEVRLRPRQRPVHPQGPARPGRRDPRRPPRRQGQGREGQDLREDGQRRPRGGDASRHRLRRRLHQALRRHPQPQEADPQLPDARAGGQAAPARAPSLALALDYAAHRESWDGLLKRPSPRSRPTARSSSRRPR